MREWNRNSPLVSHHWSGFAILIAGLLLASPVSALEDKVAPQVLALVSMDRPLQLRCLGDDCFVELSAFCLQPNRTTPKRGTRYQMTGLGGIRATGYTHDGASVALDAKIFQISALRTHVAVRMSIPSHVLREKNIARVEITVLPNVSLVAMPSEDYEPQDEMSIAAASGPLRKIGSRVVDRNEEEMSAARITNRIANNLPPRTHVDRKTTRRLWSSIENSGILEAIRPNAVRILSGAYRECEGKHKLGGMTTMRECVSQMHDRLLDGLNAKYWDLVRGTS